MHARTMHTHTHSTYIHTRTHMHTQAHRHIPPRTQHMHTRTHTCTHTHTHTHTYIHSKVSLVNKCTLMYFEFLQKQSVSINSAAERVRITLKEIGTLTYACPNADDLIVLDEQLKAIKSAFQESYLPWKDWSSGLQWLTERARPRRSMHISRQE